MTKPFIVFSDGLNEKIFQEFKEIEDFDVFPEKKISRDRLLEIAPDISGLVIRSATTVDQELINHCSQLKYIIRAGEGTDNIDKKYCTDRGIKVSNTPGANSNSAAEHAIALMMSVLRKTPWANQSMIESRWDKSLYTGNELWKKTIGFVGFGRIGKIVAKRLSGFEPNIIFYDPFIENDLEPGYRKKSLEEVFTESDIITIHTPLTDETKNLVDEKLLGLMHPGAILINAARGGIVNEEHLFTLLTDKKIRGAGLDVFAKEPLEENSPLRSLSNVVMTPHLGASTEEAQERVGLMAAQQLKEFFINGNLLNEVHAS